MKTCDLCNRRVKTNKKGSNKGICKDCIKLHELSNKVDKLIERLTPVLIERGNLEHKIYSKTE